MKIKTAHNEYHLIPIEGEENKFILKEGPIQFCPKPVTVQALPPKIGNALYLRFLEGPCVGESLSTSPIQEIEE